MQKMNQHIFVLQPSKDRKDHQPLIDRVANFFSIYGSPFFVANPENSARNAVELRDLLGFRDTDKARGPCPVRKNFLEDDENLRASDATRRVSSSVH